MDNNQTIEIVKIKKVTIKDIEVDAVYINKIEIYESLSQPGIIGVIDIRDFKGLQEQFNIFADDYIKIFVGIDSEEENDISLIYKIYTNEGSSFLNTNRYDILRLGFCSPWLIDGLTNYISKPYGTSDTPIKISDIVADLLKECGAEIGYIEPTKQTFENFVTPRWTPYHSIKYLLSMATNEDMNGGYICWTDIITNKVNVTSLDYLIKGNLGKYNSFIMNPMNLRYSGRVIDMTFESSYDLIRTVNNGLPKHNITGFNYDKKGHISTNKSMKDFNQKRLGKKFPIPKRFLELLEEGKLGGKFTPLFPPTDESTNEEQIFNLMEGKLSNEYSFLTSDIFKINIKSLGEMKRRVGWLALLEYPSSDKNKNESDKIDNKKFKGEYLIREIKHEISLSGDYNQYITLISDGYQEFDAELIEW